MGGAFGDMMLRHARALGYAVNQDNSVTHPSQVKKKPKTTSDNSKLSVIQATYRTACQKALVEFHLGVMKHQRELKAAGLLQDYDSPRTMLNRLTGYNHPPLEDDHG